LSESEADPGEKIKHMIWDIKFEKPHK
jgi:hypothetical protein